MTYVKDADAEFSLVDQYTRYWSTYIFGSYI